MNNIVIVKPDEMCDEEAQVYVKQEIEIWKDEFPWKVLGRVELIIDGEEIEIKTFERSPITRVRRITGYLSTTSSFNDAKKAELKDRVSQL